MKKRIYISFLLFLIAFIIFFVCYAISNSFLFSLLISVYELLLSRLIIDFRKHVVYIFFLVSFGSFLLLKPIAIELLDFTNEYRLIISDNEKTVTYFCLLLSIVSITIGYSIKPFRANNEKAKPISVSRLKSYQLTSFFFTILGLLVTIVGSFLKYKYVKMVGYTSSFLSSGDISVGLSEPFNSIAIVTPIACALFFASKPSKKMCLIPFCLLLTNGFVTLLYGNRFEIMAVTFFIITYKVLRDNDGVVKWFDMKKLVLLVLFIPIIISVLQYTIYWREGKNIRIRDSVYTDFFYSIGGSSDLIGFANRYENQLTNGPYSTGRIYRSLNNNAIARILGISKKFDSQTREIALSGHSLSSFLTYKLYPTKYAQGYGMGDCFIADLYADLSYFGVILGSLFIGMVIKLINGMNNKPYFICTISIFLISHLLRIPRDTFDYFLSEFVGLKNWLFIFIFLFLSSLVEKRVKSK